VAGLAGLARLALADLLTRIEAQFTAERSRRADRNDSRVALSLETGSRNAAGLTEYLVIHGTPRVTGGGAPELLQRLAHTYLGPDVRFPPMDNPPPGYITHVRVERVTGVGPWAARG
jgi:hypothetical protein